MPASSPTQRRGLPLCTSLLTVLLLTPAARSESGVWPRQFASTSGTFIVYQPQPEQLEGEHLSARAAFSLQKADSASVRFGVLWFRARVQVDRDSSLVTESELDVTRVRLPGTPAAEASRYEQMVETEAASWDLSGSLEQLQAEFLFQVLDLHRERRLRHGAVLSRQSEMAGLRHRAEIAELFDRDH